MPLVGCGSNRGPAKDHANRAELCASSRPVEGPLNPRPLTGCRALSMPWLGSARSLEVQVRRLLVAGFAALAVLLGLVATTGVASAAAPVLSDTQLCLSAKAALAALGVGDTAGLAAANAAVASACATVTTGTSGGDADWRHRRSGTSGGVTSTPCTVDHNPHAPGCQDSGPIYGGPRGGGYGGGYGGSWHPGLPWGGSPTLYGHQLWLNANLGLDICGYGNSYDTFLGRNLVHRSDIDRYLGRSRWQSLYSSDCNSNLAVIPGGLTLVNGNLLNLSLLGLQGAGTVNVCDYPSYDIFNSRLGGRYGNRWDSVRNRFGGNAFNVYRQLRVNARCTTVIVPSSTTIVQQPAQTLEAAPSTDPAPAVAPSADDGASKPMASGPVPSGAVQTGGDSIGFVLAHNRAV